jgi:GntP family gluconate:H+ symporter
MLMGSFSDNLSNSGSPLNNVLHFIGGADIALLIGVLVSFITFGRLRGFTSETILKFTTECLAPTAMITLLVGAGGGFGRILQDSGTAQAIVNLAVHAHISILLLAWMVAAVVRLSTGSATVAMATAAGIIAPLATHIPGLRPELLTIATGAGSLIFSHVNDGGFWLIKQYFNMTVADTMKTWSICETIISVVALLLTLGLSAAF